MLIQLLIQIVEYSMQCMNYAKREQEKPLLFKLTLRSRFTTTSLIGLSTLNSNRTNHKLRKKLANQKCRHMGFEHDIVH